MKGFLELKLKDRTQYPSGFTCYEPVRPDVRPPLVISRVYCRRLVVCVCLCVCVCVCVRDRLDAAAGLQGGLGLPRSERVARLETTFCVRQLLGALFIRLILGFQRVVNGGLIVLSRFGVVKARP
jgi:hypothetical protein